MRLVRSQAPTVLAPLSLTRAGDPIIVTVEAVRIGANDAEVAIGDMATVQVRHGQRDTHVRVGLAVAVLRRRGGGCVGSGVGNDVAVGTSGNVGGRWGSACLTL